MEQEAREKKRQYGCPQNNRGKPKGASIRKREDRMIKGKAVGRERCDGEKGDLRNQERVRYTKKRD